MADPASAAGTAADDSTPSEPVSFNRVLSIQSHVVHGYVGNKSATFPLQLLGFDVDPINSVHFSNHTAYPGGFKGDVLKGDQLLTLLEALKTNKLTRYSHVLTGYIGAVDFLQAVVKVVRDIRAANPGKKVPYYCDPVLGDNGKCYVPPALIDVYKNEVVSIATVLTPNQFECELLTGIKIQRTADLQKTFDHFHKRGVEKVIITSLDGLEDPPFNDESKIYMVASEIVEGSESTRVHCISVPRIPSYFVGTGDLTAALLLAWVHKSKSLSTALDNACASIQAVLRRTWETPREKGSDTGAPKELLLIQSAKDILQPPVEGRSHEFNFSEE